MNTNWFELNDAVVALVAQLTLCLAILGYLISLPSRDLDAKLFAGYMLSIVLVFASVALEGLLVYPPLKMFFEGMTAIILIMGLLYTIWFAYQIRGNPYKRESYGSLLFFGLLTGISLYLSSIDETFTIFFPLAYLIGTFWIIGVFGRKSRKVEKEAGGPTASSKMLRDFQRWAFLVSLIYLIASYNPFAMLVGLPRFTFDYYFFSLLSFIHVTYATIVFLNYTPQRTSFQAKIVGLVLCPLLIILALTPFLLRSLILNLPNFKLVNQQIAVATLILIPITAIAVIFGLPRFLRSNLLSPLNQILEGVRQVDSGNLSVQVPVTVNDEVGKLAEQFNSMTSSLKRYSSEMETLVSERTTQLQQSLDTLKSTQSQLIQQEKLASLGQLTAGIAHEIKNPLNFVNNFSEVSRELIAEIKEERGKSQEERDETLVNEILDDIQSNLEKIHEHGSRANGIVSSMLQHSRGGSGKLDPTDLNVLIKEYVNLSFHGMRAGKNPIDVEIAFELDPEIKEVPLIKEDFIRVIINLCNNAFDAMRGKVYQTEDGRRKTEDNSSIAIYDPRLKVTTSLEKGQVQIALQDNGPGIPDEIKDKILQPFFTTKKGTEGTGLGLSISNDIIKAHGGSLAIESGTNGSIFTIIIPTNS